jgi:hypothetical protein
VLAFGWWRIMNPLAPLHAILPSTLQKRMGYAGVPLVDLRGAGESAYSGSLCEEAGEGGGTACFFVAPRSRRPPPAPRHRRRHGALAAHRSRGHARARPLSFGECAPGCLPAFLNYSYCMPHSAQCDANRPSLFASTLAPGE